MKLQFWNKESTSFREIGVAVWIADPLESVIRRAASGLTQLYRGNGNITQPNAKAKPRKVRKTVAPYWSRSFGDSFEVSEKTKETQNAKIVRAVKCDSSMRLFLSPYRNIESIQND
jgi:hypothetical protein